MVTRRELARNKKWDVGPRISDPTPEQVNQDLFADWPVEKNIMGIFDIFNLPFFQNLVWRLRSHEHFDTLECFRTYRMSMIKPLGEAANTGVYGHSPYGAAKIADLLNNIDRFGGWDQTTAL